MNRRLLPSVPDFSTDSPELQPLVTHCAFANIKIDEIPVRHAQFRSKRFQALDRGLIETDSAGLFLFRLPEKEYCISPRRSRIIA